MRPYTRISATTDGPRDAVEILSTAAQLQGTSYSTNPEQTEVTEI